MLKIIWRKDNYWRRILKEARQVNIKILNIRKYLNLQNLGDNLNITKCN